MYCQDSYLSVFAYGATSFSTNISYEVAFLAVFGDLFALFNCVWDFSDFERITWSVVSLVVWEFDLVLNESVADDKVAYTSVTTQDRLADLSGAVFWLADRVATTGFTPKFAISPAPAFPS